jgi:hypothetical protein
LRPGWHVEVAIPEVAGGSYFRLAARRRKRAERAVVSVMATTRYLLGVGAADGEPRHNARHHPVVQVASQRVMARELVEQAWSRIAIADATLGDRAYEASDDHVRAALRPDHQQPPSGGLPMIHSLGRRALDALCIVLALLLLAAATIERWIRR